MKTKWTASELKAMSREEIDKLYEIVTWYEGLRETNNETFLPLFADTHRYLVLKGGGGSGKCHLRGTEGAGAGGQRAGTPLPRVP